MYVCMYVCMYVYTFTDIASIPSLTFYIQIVDHWHTTNVYTIKSFPKSFATSNILIDLISYPKSQQP
uniref:Uncharacterized protein n=1 Tax=Octopus bimaculoides TaxID=37653 RepID=A0A0L8HEN9_OCTBM